MESFYGGRQGASFVLVKSFGSKAEMVSAFKQGGSYTAVHYDEYVIINSENKNNENNGSIYRRGYNYTNADGGAIYIGTIVGPDGKAPMLKLTTIAEVNSQANSAGPEEFQTSSGSYTLQDKNLVSGKDSSEIKYACCSIRDEDGTSTTAYIGFQIPYLVIDFEAAATDSNSSFSATRTDDESNPFYEKWKIQIPSVEATKLTWTDF
jgi:hypothetical protein